MGGRSQRRDGGKRDKTLRPVNRTCKFVKNWFWYPTTTTTTISTNIAVSSIAAPVRPVRSARTAPGCHIDLRYIRLSPVSFNQIMTVRNKKCCRVPGSVFCEMSCFQMSIPWTAVVIWNNTACSDPVWQLSLTSNRWTSPWEYLVVWFPNF